MQMELFKKNIEWAFNYPVNPNANSRPLTHIPVSSIDMEPLTLIQFLLETTLHYNTQTPGPVDELFRHQKQWKIVQ